MNIRKMIATAAVAGMLVPLAASAQSSDVMSQINSLMTQIQALQAQLKTLMMTQIGTSTLQMIKDKVSPMGMPPGQMGKMVCITLDRNLRQGSEGDDVRKLQEMLLSDHENGFDGDATGFFGPVTARAMVKFQMRMGIASSTDGSVGPLTRGFFERSCGKGMGMSPQGGMMGGGMTGGDMRGVVVGSITASDAASITVQMKDGIYRTVYVSASTTIHVFASATSSPTVGTMADLTLGKNVMAEGKPRDNGGIDAKMIKVGNFPMPMQGMMMKGDAASTGYFQMQVAPKPPMGPPPQRGMGY